MHSKCVSITSQCLIEIAGHAAPLLVFFSGAFSWLSSVFGKRARSTFSSTGFGVTCRWHGPHIFFKDVQLAKRPPSFFGLIKDKEKGIEMLKSTTDSCTASTVRSEYIHTVYGLAWLNDHLQTFFGKPNSLP